MQHKRNKETFDKFLSAFKDKKLVIATHRKADIDGLMSAHTLSKLLPGSVIAVPDELDDGAEKLAGRLGIDVKVISELKQNDFDGMAVVDTSAFTMIEDARKWNVVLIIDHHEAEGTDMSADYVIIEPEAPSTAELVVSLAGYDSLDKELAFGLSCAIIADTARFKSSTADTFEILGKLMRICSDVPYTELLEYGEPELKPTAKLAVLEGLQNVEFVWHADYIIATSETVSNESDTASLLAEVADAGFVASWKSREKETRISSRASKRLPVGLNEVMKEVGESFGRKGGGHKKAAGASADGHPEAVLKKCVDVLITKLEEKRV